MIAYYGERFGFPKHLPPVPDSPKKSIAMTMQMADFSIHDEQIVKKRKVLRRIEAFGRRLIAACNKRA